MALEDPSILNEIGEAYLDATHPVPPPARHDEHSPDGASTSRSQMPPSIGSGGTVRMSLGGQINLNVHNNTDHPIPQSTVYYSTTTSPPAPRPAIEADNQVPQQPILFLDEQVDTVCTIVNEEPGGRKDFKKTYGVAYRKCDAVEDIIEHGIDKKIRPESYFESKYNALIALVEIGNDVLDAVPSEFAKETRNGGATRKITDAMARILETLSNNEKRQVLQRGV